MSKPVLHFFFGALLSTSVSLAERSEAISPERRAQIIQNLGIACSSEEKRKESNVPPEVCQELAQYNAKEAANKAAVQTPAQEAIKETQVKADQIVPQEQKAQDPISFKTDSGENIEVKVDRELKIPLKELMMDGSYEFYVIQDMEVKTASGKKMKVFALTGPEETMKDKTKRSHILYERAQAICALTPEHHFVKNVTTRLVGTGTYVDFSKASQSGGQITLGTQYFTSGSNATYFTEITCAKKLSKK